MERHKPGTFCFSSSSCMKDRQSAQTFQASLPNICVSCLRRQLKVKLKSSTCLREDKAKEVDGMEGYGGRERLKERM